MKDYSVKFSFEFPTNVEDLFSHWIEPILLNQWISTDCRVKPRESFLLWFINKKTESKIFGQYLTYQPFKALKFTWESSKHHRSIVELNFSPIDQYFSHLSLQQNLLAKRKSKKQNDFWLFYLGNLHNLLSKNKDLRPSTLNQVVKIN